jgi:hypothetical protein
MKYRTRIYYTEAVLTLPKSALGQFDTGGCPMTAAPGAELTHPTADSTGQRNGMAEHLSRRAIAERLPWPLVQLSRYGVELGL